MKAIVVACVAALACAAVALGAPGDPQRHFTARDQAHAKTLPLGKADLPGKGWKAEKTDFSGANPACLVKHYSLEDLTVTGEAGFTYSLGGGLVGVESDGHVFRTPAEAAKAFAIETGLGLGRCLGSALAANIQKSTPSVTATVSKVVPVTLKGLGAKVKGFRVTIALKSRKNKNTTFSEITQLSLLDGRDLASLGLISTGAHWGPKSTRAIAAKAAARL